jgi:hypothetical protein
MDLGLFALIIGVITLAGVVVVVLEASTLFDLGVMDTLRDLWRTFFGGYDDLPESTDEDLNPRLDE